MFTVDVLAISAISFFTGAHFKFLKNRKPIYVALYDECKLTMYCQVCVLMSPLLSTPPPLCLLLNRKTVLFHCFYSTMSSARAINVEILQRRPMNVRLLLGHTPACKRDATYASCFFLRLAVVFSVLTTVDCVAFNF